MRSPSRLPSSSSLGEPAQVVAQPRRGAEVDGVRDLVQGDPAQDRARLALELRAAPRRRSGRRTAAAARVRGRAPGTRTGRGRAARRSRRGRRAGRRRRSRMARRAAPARACPSPSRPSISPTVSAHRLEVDRCPLAPADPLGIRNGPARARGRCSARRRAPTRDGLLEDLRRRRRRALARRELGDPLGDAPVDQLRSSAALSACRARPPAPRAPSRGALGSARRRPCSGRRGRAPHRERRCRRSRRAPPASVTISCDAAASTERQGRAENIASKRAAPTQLIVIAIEPTTRSR